MNHEEKYLPELRLVTLLKKSIIINFFYETFFKNVVEKFSHSDFFQKYLLQLFYTLFVIIIGSIALILYLFWQKVLLFFLTLKTFSWFYTNYLPIMQNNASVLFEYYTSFFTLMLIRSISSVPVYYLPTFIILCSIVFTIKLFGDAECRKSLFIYVRDKLTKPLNELNNISQLFCFLFECAFNCAKNSSKILTITKITDVSDFINKIDLLVTDPDFLPLEHNDNESNDTIILSETDKTNDDNTDNDSNSCDLDETL